MITALSRRCSRRVGALLVAVLALGPAAVARARENDAPITLTYRASEGCPDRAAFIDRVRSRTPSVNRARLRDTQDQVVPSGPGAEEGPLFDVQVDAGPPASGQVTVRETNRVGGARRVQAESCAEVVDALALVVALAIDPRAPVEPATSTAAATQPSTSGPVTTAPAPVPPAPASVSVRPEPKASPASPAVEASSSPSQPGPPDGPGTLVAGVDAALDLGVSPVALVGPSAYVGWRSKSTGLLSPEVRLAVDRAESGTLTLLGGTAAFTWTVGRADACPVARVTPRLRLSACARLEVGTLEVAGGDIVAPQTRVRFWLSAGALARGEWTFLRPLFVNIEAGGNVRGTNDRFFFYPDTTVYQVPLVGLSAAGGIGAHFL